MMRCGVLLIVVASLTGHVIGQLEFTVEPDNVTVESGMKATLSCMATGVSAILYVWHKDNISEGLGVTSNTSDRIHFANHSLITDNNGTLVLNEVTADDEGVYFCRAMEHNNASHFIVSDPAYLTVTMVTTVLLSVTILPEDNVTVRNDTEVLLHCVTMGDTDNITYSWYKDDILLSDHRVSVLDNGSLLINVTDYRHDNGDYYCEAIDHHGNNASSDSTSLSVVYLEEQFLSQPINLSLMLNDTHDTKIRIDCIPPEGYPMVTVSWIRQLSNGMMVPVEEDDRISIRLKWLTIKAAWVNDTGFYQCVASNGYYERPSHFVYINVLPSIKPPCPELSFNFSRPPAYGVIGKPLSLHCITSGSRGWTYTWKRSGDMVTQFNQTDYGTLILGSYHGDDSGSYSCFVSSSADCNQQADAAHINVVTATNGSFTSVSQPITAGVGRSFHLNCSSSEAKPAANMTWIFNGVAIATSVPATSVEEETYVDYTHSSAELSDGGVYVCRAENVAGFWESSVNVTIFERPSVTINSEVVQLGNNVVLNCSSSSVNVTDIIWQHNGSPLRDDGDKYVIELSSSNNLSILTVMDIGEDDFGPYQCTITDDLHVIISVIGYVNHTNKIYFTHDVSVAQAEVGETAQLNCSVAGVVTNVTFTWFEDNRQLYNNGKYNMTSSDNDLIYLSQLTIKEVGKNVRYSYHCQAHDMDSEMIQTTFTLTTTLKPFFRTRPRNITMVAIGGTLSIHCDIDGRPKPSVTWTHDNLSKVKNDSSRLISFPNGTLVITSVVKSDYGIYFCHATSNVTVNHKVQIVEASSSDDSEDDKIAGLAEDVFLVVIGVVVMVIIYTAIMCLMLCLCCYCRKQDNKQPPYRQERNLYTPDPEPAKESRGDSVLSKTSNGVKDVPGMTYYGLPHPFSRASSDARSHDTMELIRMGDIERTQNTASRSSQVTEPIDHHDNQFPSSTQPVFPRANLQFSSKLGDGEFGPVYQGFAKELVAGESDTLVAIKMLLHPRDSDDDSSSGVQDIDNFRAQMKLQYTNIASILAMCTDIRPYYIVYEYLDCGDLKKFLCNSSPEGDQPPKLTQHSLLQIILQVADGMSYLSSNKIIHGDLAARNCLISSELRVKVADLGIGHDVYNDDYYDDGTQLLPIRWMPPEILRTAEFSIYSDMWSFGVLCWEVFSFGRQPYEMVSNEELLALIPAGVQLQIPEEGCPNPLYAIMQDCWNMQPEKRPKFAYLCVAIIDLDLD